MKILKKIIVTSVMTLITMSMFAQEWKEWESHDIKAFYVEIDEDEASEYYNAEEFNDRWFVPTKLKSDVCAIEIGEKVESKFYRINGTKYYMKFRFNPFLWRWDKGVLVVSGSGGTFYKKDD